VTVRSELRLNRVAHEDVARPMRHALRAFLIALELDANFYEDILTATGEALANAVEHAYHASAPGNVELYADFEGDVLTIDVADGGTFIDRERRPGRGFGLRIVRAIARTVSIETHGGTRVHMVFDVPHANTPASVA